jgi:hypothetical protein
MNTIRSGLQYWISAIACITALSLSGCEKIYKQEVVSIEENSVNLDFEKGVAQYKGKVRQLKKQEFPKEASGVIAALSIKNSSGKRINANEIKVLVKKKNPIQVWVKIDATSYCYEVDLVGGVWTIIGSC